jgi:hypothetical protein
VLASDPLIFVDVSGMKRQQFKFVVALEGLRGGYLIRCVGAIIVRLTAAVRGGRVAKDDSNNHERKGLSYRSEDDESAVGRGDGDGDGDGEMEMGKGKSHKLRYRLTPVVQIRGNCIPLVPLCLLSCFTRKKASTCHVKSYQSFTTVSIYNNARNGMDHPMLPAFRTTAYGAIKIAMKADLASTVSIYTILRNRGIINIRYCATTRHYSGILYCTVLYCTALYCIDVKSERMRNQRQMY